MNDNENEIKEALDSIKEAFSDMSDFEAALIRYCKEDQEKKKQNEITMNKPMTSEEYEKVKLAFRILLSSWGHSDEPPMFLNTLVDALEDDAPTVEDLKKMADWSCPSSDYHEKINWEEFRDNWEKCDICERYGKTRGRPISCKPKYPCEHLKTKQ